MKSVKNNSCFWKIKWFCGFSSEFIYSSLREAEKYLFQMLRHFCPSFGSSIYKHIINLLLSIISITNVLALLLVFILEYKP